MAVGGAAPPTLPWDQEAGYFTVPLLGPEIVTALRTAYEALPIDPECEFHATNVSSPRSQARAVDQYLKQVLRDRVREIIGDFEPFLGAFIIKGSRLGNPVEFHQDWTYCDERTHRAVLVWIPLVDVDAGNGALAAVPGSHRWTSGVRPSHRPNPGAEFQAELAARSQVVPMRAGDAFIYDPGLWHGSSPNPTDRARPVAAIAFAPAGVRLEHFDGSDPTRLRGGEVTEAWFSQAPFAELAPDAPPVAPWAAAVDAAAVHGGLRG